jgi:catechol 2,3-dioxygenase-like lactoylglutathione lyase family enzyme
MLTRIASFTVAVENLDRSVAAYRSVLGYEVQQRGRIDSFSAAAWHAPRLEGQAWARVAAPTGDPAALRLIEQPPTPAYDAARSLGWTAIEIAVRDPYALAATLEGSPFRVVVPPRPLPWDAGFHAMQALGPDGELLYLTRLPAERVVLDLRGARCDVDRAFIAVQGCRDLQATLDFYRSQLGMPTLDGGETRVQIINDRFGLPADHRTRLGIVKLPQDFLIEVDAYPRAAVPRAQAAGWLPPGISMVSFEDDSVSAADVLQGPDGEWIERLPVAAAR